MRTPPMGLPRCAHSKSTSSVLAGLLLLAACAIPLAGPARAEEQAAPAAGLTPDNTVILANAQDARFSRDYSVLLKQLRLDWVFPGGSTPPAAALNTHLILLGRPDSPLTGELIREALTPAQLEEAGAAGGRVVLERDNPWAPGKRLIVCAGADPIRVRDAAEEAVRALVERHPPTSDWIRTRFDAPLDERERDQIERLLFTWEDEELPLEELLADVGATPRRRIPAEQAAEDTERLFHLFSHGYAGYAFFERIGSFDEAEARILERLATQREWSSRDFSRLLYEELDFVIDCHLNIGEIQFGGHLHFWYDTELELMPGTAGYRFTTDGVARTLVSVNGADPEPFVFPSLNARGEPIYRLGTLSKTDPGPLQLVATGETGEHSLEIALQRSDFTWYSNDLFREDNLGGIPVLRVRGFGDPGAADLERFVEAGSAHRGDPVVVVDIRGNQGGNEAWPIAWIQGLTGERADAVFIFAELNSKTSMASRANTFAYLHDRYPGVELYERDAKDLAEIVETFEKGEQEPYWRGPFFPHMPPIPNETTVVIVTNGMVASAGEGLVMRASRAENVMLVGENTRGCLTFGNPGDFLLPHSRLKIHMPINLGLYPDMAFREEIGVKPDLWVPAADAVNYTVAALRSGTIRTELPLPPEAVGQPFVPENPWALQRGRRLRLAVLIAVFGVGAAVWSWFVRRRPSIVAGVGLVWLFIGAAWLYLGKEVGYAFLMAGGVCLVAGGIFLWRKRGEGAGGKGARLGEVERGIAGGTPGRSLDRRGRAS